MIDLTRLLVQTPSQAGHDDVGDALAALRSWWSSRGLEPKVLEHSGKPVALVAEIAGERPGPTLVLNACIDTAPFGNERLWEREPTSGELVDGWLHGRGSADSKVGVAMFSHLLVGRLEEGVGAGRLQLFVDADEHSGKFGGVGSFMNAFEAPDAVMIGYPGLDKIHVGARGFWRAEILILGRGGHSASEPSAQLNAAAKAAELVTALTELELADDPSGGMTPQLTVTRISSGSGFTSVPDKAVVGVDVRLTPNFTAADAAAAVASVLEPINRELPVRARVRERASWPAYKLSPSEPVVRALAAAAMHEFGHPLPTAIASPSNVGNFFASAGVPATCGFGVRYRNIHAPDEQIDVASIEPVLRTYKRAVANFLNGELAAVGVAPNAAAA